MDQHRGRDILGELPVGGEYAFCRGREEEGERECLIEVGKIRTVKIMEGREHDRRNNTMHIDLDTPSCVVRSN